MSIFDVTSRRLVEREDVSSLHENDISISPVGEHPIFNKMICRSEGVLSSLYISLLSDIAAHHGLFPSDDDERNEYNPPNINLALVT